MGAISVVIGGILKLMIFLLRAGVVVAGFSAVLLILLIPLKAVVGALAKALGVNGGGGGGGAISGSVGKLLGTAVGAVDRGINGVFNGVGTVFGGVTRTAGMARDKIFGMGSGRRGYRDRDRGYREGRHRRDYSEDYYGNNYEHNNHRYRNNQNQAMPMNLKADGTVALGDPNNPEDPYYGQQRFYDDYGYDQFGYDKEGNHKDSKLQEYLDKEMNSKMSVKDVFGDKTIADNEVVDKWVRNTEFKKPSTWAFGAAGMTYAAAHALGKAMKLRVPEEWEKDDVIDSGIRTYDIEQDDINKAAERKEKINRGEESASKGIDKNKIVDNLINREDITVPETIEYTDEELEKDMDNIFSNNEILNDIGNEYKQKDPSNIDYSDYMSGSMEWNSDKTKKEPEKLEDVDQLLKNNEKEKVLVGAESEDNKKPVEKEMEMPLFQEVKW